MQTAARPSREGSPSAIADHRGSLTGLTVIDFSRVVAGPLCGQMLADHGANVIKVEGPGGDELRTYGPPFGENTSAYFDGINRNKRNICLDLNTEDGREVAARLVADADIVIENFKAGTMDRWGIGYESLFARNPRLIYCRITGFGTEGPMASAPGYDALLQAYSGIMSLSGAQGDGPVRVGLPVVDLSASMQAFSGILLALFERTHSGRGQLVDCTLLDAALSLLHPHASAWAMYGSEPKRMGNAHGSVAPYEIFETATGPIMLAANNNAQFRKLAETLGHPDLVDNPKFSSNAERVAHRVELAAILGLIVAEEDAAELSDLLLAEGVPATAVFDVPSALAQPQIAHRQMLVSKGSYTGLGIPVKLSRTPGRVHRAPVSKGSDTTELLTEMAYTPDQVSRMIRSEAAVQDTSAGSA